MNIYKVAQIKFSNEDEVIKQIGKIRDSEFQAYISVLSQMHSDMLDGSMELQEAAIEAAGRSFSSALIRLVNNIGIDTFLGSEFSQISESLSDLRLSDLRTQPKEQPQLGFIPGLSQTEFVGTDGQYLDMRSLLGMSMDERLKYFNELNYPENLRTRAFHMIKNMKLIDEVYSNPKTTEKVRSIYQKELVSAMLSLIEMAKGNDIEEEKEEEVSEEDKAKRVVIDSEPKEEDSSSSEPDKIRGRSSVSAASVSSKINDDEILDQDLFDGTEVKVTLKSSNNPYVDYTVSPPVVNTDDITSIFGKFVTEIMRLMQSGLGGGSKKDLKQKFNDVVFSIKKADYQTFSEFLERKKNMLPEEAEGYRLAEFELSSWLPSQQILSDPDFSETFFSASIICGSPKLGELLLVEDNDTFYNEIKKDPRNDHITPDQVDIIKNEMIAYVRRTFKTKAKEYFDLNSTYSERNFIGKIGLRWDLVFRRATQKKIVHGPEYVYKPCPTCFKYIPWSYSTAAKKNAPDNEEMRIKLYSFFTRNPEMPKITIEHLNSRTWPVLPPNMYTRKREQLKVIQYAKDGEKSWEEITNLINSNDINLQEEGMHRRSGALAYSGGIELSTQNLKINQIMSSCPVGNEGTSACGISFIPVANTVLPPELSLQPTWNGEKTNKASSSFDYSIGDDEFGGGNIAEQAKRLQRSGRKFSKINFACTCHIQEITDLTSYKHGNLAVSKPGPAGSKGFLYPTKPDGSLNTDIKNGTLAFLVCGAPTSLSAFERNPKNAGFILKHFIKIKNESIDDYAEMIGYLIRQGLEFNDVMLLDQHLDEYYAQSKAGFTGSVKARIERLTEIIKEAQIKMTKENVGSDIRRLFGGLTLVCPFGHRFSIEHSLQFGEKYAGIFQKEGAASLYSDIITSQGDANIRSLLKPRGKKIGYKESSFIVPVDHPEMTGFTKLPYEEWIQANNGVVFPIVGQPDRPVLTFELPVNLSGESGRFMFYSKPLGGKNFVWNPDKSFASSNQQVAYMDLSEEEKSALQSRVSSGNMEGVVDLIDKATANQWNIQQGNEHASDGYNRPPGISIPGAGKLYDENGEPDTKQLDVRIASFSRALRSSLRVITTWTKGIVNDGMIDAMLSDRSVDVTIYEDKMWGLLSPHILMEVIDEDGEEVEPSQSVKAQLTVMAKRVFIESLNKKVNGLYDWIRTNIYGVSNDKSFNEEVAAKIIESCVKEFNGLNPGGDIGMVYLNIQRNSINDFAANIANQAVRKYPNLALEITLSSRGQHEAEKNRVQYIGRVALISYAQYLATALSLIYKKYCADPSSDFYIGYNIGIDLSSVENIIGYENGEGEWVGGITDRDIENMVSSLDEALANGPFPRLDAQTLDYGYRIDKAWIELEAYLRTSRKQTMSSRGMELAKDYLISRISFLSGTQAKDLKDRISNVFPNRSMLFNGTTANPETGTSQISKRRLPFIAKSINMIQVPGTERVEEWTVRNPNTGDISVFNSEEEAKAYASSNPEINMVISPDPYWVNPEYNYDGSKIQIGITAPKAGTDMKWPPVPGRFAFAGINLPFSITSKRQDASVNKAKLVPIPNFRFVVDFDGDPLDVSFLFRRGTNNADIKNIKKWENIIIAKSRESKQNIRIFKQQHADAIAKSDAILSRFRAEEEDRLSAEIAPYLRSIDSLGLQISTTKSYVDPDGMSARPMMRASLEDPLTAYNIIINPEVRGKTLSKVERDRLISFIIRIYNLDLIRDMARTKGGKYKHLQSVDLLAKAHEMKFSFLRSMMKKPSWTDPDGNKRLGYFVTPGEYFNVSPGEKNSDTGSFLQYVYSTSPNVESYLPKGTHPSVTDLVGASRYVRLHGLENAGEIDDSGKGLSRKIEEDMLDYIKTRTSGDRENPAKDRRRRKKASSHYNEILLRRSKLDRMILSLGIFNFDDVEMPNF